jgi:peptidoglycan pentaglycine glycine transferase (the first glycine)
MLTTMSPSNEQWNAFVQTQPRAHLLQLSAWGDLKTAYGWGAARVALTENDQIVAGAQILFRRLPFGLGTMAYLPMGPYMDDTVGARHDVPLQTELWQAIDDVCRQHNARFLKWEPGIVGDDAPPDFAALGFRASPQTVQPPNTVLVDISGDDETIMKRMNQGTRRKIRQSLKKGAEYTQGTRADVDKYNAIMQVTGTRNEFGVHEAAYYEKAYDLFVPDDAALFMAENEGDVLAGIMVFAVGQTAWYVYGASSSLKRNLMASYGVQWQAIQWARARGCRYYDMWGIPDADEATLEAQFKDRSDGLWGVYGFKRGWGGEVVRALGAWDKVYNPLVYAAYQMYLKIRAKA